MTSELVEQLEQSKMEPCGKDEDMREGELTRLEDYSKSVSQTVMDASDSSIDTKPLDEMKEWNWRYFDVAAHPDHSEGIETCLNAMLQRRTILLKMNIKLPCKNGSKAKEGTIVIRETDNVKTVVEGFSKQHNLPSESSNYLMKVVSEALADVRKKGNDVVGCGDEENGPVMPDGTITAMRRNAESYSVRSGGRLGRKGSEVRGSGNLSRTPSSTPMSTLSPRRTVSSDFQSTQYPRSTTTAELIDPLGEQIEEEREAEMKELKSRKEVKKRRKTKGSPLRKKEGKKESFFERSKKHEEKMHNAAILLIGNSLDRIDSLVRWVVTGQLVRVDESSEVSADRCFTLSEA
ncbi:hypothetical protein BLNAU_12135 [Blattamonas nauphoetae]|uniref:Uncharacterized protein n=1 Tax=Blattamonas nauphoetae TaxID=2049346 RepID=A0ABQ9XQ80_9EUKA|nr:hypothetical protein BLNAU_12135 [Blattamonas nauphoetae]